MYEPTHRCSPSIVRSAALRSHVFHYGVKVWRIRRQVAEACTNSPDRLLHTSDLVERDIVDHHNVSALERWDQTLLCERCDWSHPSACLINHRAQIGGKPPRISPPLVST